MTITMYMYNVMCAYNVIIRVHVCTCLCLSVCMYIYIVHVHVGVCELGTLGCVGRVG